MTDEVLCAWRLWDDACGEPEAAEIHQDRLRWNFHFFVSPQVAEWRIRHANTLDVWRRSRR